MKNGSIRIAMPGFISHMAVFMVVIMQNKKSLQPLFPPNETLTCIQNIEKRSLRGKIN